MSDWGPDTYGNPCGECGYDWPEDLATMVEVVASTPDRMAVLLGGRSGRERVPALGWDAGAYVCHVADNLRIWAERLAAARAGPDAVGTYDADLLAAARRYDMIPIQGALWSARDAVRSWTDSVTRATGVQLRHPDRGELDLTDVVSANAHDAYHHVHDVERIIGSPPPAPVRDVPSGTIAVLPDTLASDAVELWHITGLTRPWNDPDADLRRALDGPTSTVLAYLDTDRLIGAAMVGHDGHRGWVYYLAVAPDRQGKGIGTELMRACEDWLHSAGVPKVQLMVRRNNSRVLAFYERIGYDDQDVTVMGKRR